jgi:ATP-binding protein involved in chromosome partitioning
VDEHSGAQRLDPRSVPESIAPTAITPMGNYGVAIKWDDGHASGIFTYAQLAEL